LIVQKLRLLGNANMAELRQPKIIAKIVFIYITESRVSNNSIMMQIKLVFSSFKRQ